MHESHITSALRWGILGTGNISTLFVRDLVIAQQDTSSPVRHVIQAIGTSTVEKGTSFVQATTIPSSQSPRIYTKYDDLYADNEVDIIYVGIPHSSHKKACLAAITAGKHVLCEKPMAINSKEVEEIVDLARRNAVFLMEGVWTRFLPIMGQLHTLIHEDKVIGTISRMYCDFGCDMTSLPMTSRVKNPKLGGGALLDLGIYPLTISNLILDGKVGDEALNPEIASAMTVVGDVDTSVAMIVNYSSKNCLGILSASLETTSEEEFCRIEGSEGIITLSGPMAAKPEVIKIRRYQDRIDDVRVFSHPGTGLYFEANAVAQDILDGKVENAVIPLAETLRLSKMMDKIRKSGGVLYSQDLKLP